MSDDTVPVPAEDSILAGLDFETPMMLDSHDALHMHFAVSHAMYQLNITPAELGLGTHRFAKPEWIGDAMREVGVENKDAMRELMVELGDFALECSNALANFLLSRGIGGARFFVFLPCHQGVAEYWPRNDKGVPEVNPW
jgi:hypothetical protein